MWTLVLAPRTAPSTCSAIEPATRSIPSSRAAPRAQPSAGAVERLRACRGLLGRPQHGPLLRQHDQLGTARGGRARQPVGRFEVAVAIGRRAELHGCGEHVVPLLDRVDSSVNPRAARIPVVRMYKAWTWVGAFGPELMLCAASARVGPARTAWWAVWDGVRLHERTFRRSGRVTATPERVHCDGVLDLIVEPGAPWAVRTGPTWTRKRPARVHGTVLGRAVELPGLVDESAGRHARTLSWWWSAGAGELADGRSVDVEPGRRAARRRRALLSNRLAAGTSTQPTSSAGTSERAVWIDGVPQHVAPQRFDGLRRRRRPALPRGRDARPQGEPAADRLGLRAAVRRVLRHAAARRGELRSGWGVMERHRVRW